MKTYILYHASCYDGFGAALAAFMKLGDDDVEYVPVSFGMPTPELEINSLVYIVDFSYPIDVLDRLAHMMKKVVVIDHHKTAEADLRDWPADLKIFDMSHSGAMLTWMYFNQPPAGGPLMLPPLFFRYLEDRDLWRWELPNSRAFSAGLASHPYDMTTWEEFVLDGAAGVDRLVEEGEHILRYQANVVALHVAAARPREFDGRLVPIANASVLMSEVGEALLLAYPNSPFSLTWFLNADGKVQYSLRSRPGFDVSVVAKRYGGGGHAQAAGFVVNSVKVGGE